jgi:HD-GYP domain-containing protein (c-di-GMP phosphodiesterase class II)/sensor domain CHASE-containing protein
MLSFSVRFVIAALLLLALKNFLFETKGIKSAAHLQPEVASAVNKFLKRFVNALVIFSIAFSMFTFGSMYIFRFTLRADLRDYTQKISLDASKTASAIQTAFSQARRDLGKFATDPNVVHLNEKGKDELKNYYLANKDKFASVSRMDKNGIIIYTYPYTESIGKNISDQPHVKKILKTYSPVLSDPVMAVQGFPAIILHVPVFNKGVFSGSIAVLFDLRELGSFSLAPVKLEKNEKILVADANGTIICAPDNSMLFKNISTIFPEKSDGTFVQCRFGYGLIVEQKFNPIPIKTFTAYAFVPKRDVFQNVLVRILLMILFGVILVVLFLYAIKSLYGAHEEESERLKKFAEIKSKESKTLSQKLQTLVSLFATIDTGKTLEEISKQLLDSALKVIEKGNAGSVLLKEGDKFVYTAVNGYPKFLEGKFLTKEEVMPSLKHRPFIIKHIFEFAEALLKDKLKPETRKLFREIGTANIKSTIEAPVIVNGEYYGGIFIDNFHSADAFTDEDLQIAEAISKLASLLIESKLLVDSLQETENKLLFVMEQFSKVDITSKEEDFFKVMLNIGKQLIPQADAGSATLKKGNFYEYVAMFGYNDILHKLKFRAGVSYSAKTSEASVVRDIAEYNKEHLTQEQLDILSKAGAFNIKQSIVAPIIVNGEYIGGIFLDSFKEGKNIFSQNDIKVATALSKLASIFVGARIIYQKLLNINSFNEGSLNLFHRVNMRASSEYALKVAYDALKPIYKKSLQEVGVWSKQERTAKLIKFDGENVFRLPIDAKSFEIAVEKKKSLFIEKADKNHPFAQAVIYTGISNIPVFRVRFRDEHIFEKEEKEFIERFGREAASLYQAVEYYTKFKNMFANYIFSIGNAVGAYNPYTEQHSIRVGYLSMHIADKVGISKDEKALLLFSAVLHDVGKIGIPQEILLKPGKLTDAEMEVIKRHPVEGEKIVKPINPEAAKIIRHHHERWDGTGYPDGLKGEQIPLLSRIITVADVFDALATDRPYRKAFGFEKAMEIMRENNGKMFDPKIFDVFLSIKTEILMKKELSKKDIEEMRETIIEIY